MTDTWSVEDHLQNKPATSVDLYWRFVELISACGAFTVAPAKTAITFKGSRRGFAGAKPTVHGLVGYLDLQRRVEGPQITRAEPYTKRLFVHHYRISSPAELDEAFAEWVREAYDVGQGAHLS